MFILTTTTEKRKERIEEAINSNLKNTGKRKTINSKRYLEAIDFFANFPYAWIYCI